MSVNVMGHDGELIKIAGNSGNPADIEALKAQIAEMKTKIAEMETALEGKAGLSDNNSFSGTNNFSNVVYTSQWIEQNVPDVGLNIASTGESNDPSIILRARDISNSAIRFHADLEKKKLKIDSYELLDSRDIPKYSNTNYDNLNMKPATNVEIISRRTYNIISDRIFLIHGRFKILNSINANSWHSLFSFTPLSANYIPLAISGTPINANCTLAFNINGTSLFVLPGTSVNENFELYFWLLGFYY